MRGGGGGGVAEWSLVKKPQSIVLKQIEGEPFLSFEHG